MNKSEPDCILKSLKLKISQSPLTARGYRQYGSALRSQIASYAQGRIASGDKVMSIAAELGIGDDMLGRWVRNSSGAPPTLKPVHITRAEALVVHGPHGLRIEGSPSSIAALVRACSAL